MEMMGRFKIDEILEEIVNELDEGKVILFIVPESSKLYTDIGLLTVSKTVTMFKLGGKYVSMIDANLLINNKPVTISDEDGIIWFCSKCGSVYFEPAGHDCKNSEKYPVMLLRKSEIKAVIYSTLLENTVMAVAPRYSDYSRLVELLRELENGRKVKFVWEEENSGRTDWDVLIIVKENNEYISYFRYSTNSNVLDRCPYCGEFYLENHECIYDEESTIEHHDLRSIVTLIFDTLIMEKEGEDFHIEIE